jgi:hypothetical protein
VSGNWSLAQESAFYQLAPLATLAGELPGAQQSRGAIEQARRQLRKAESDEDKSAAVNKLREALGDYFDRDLEAREKSLDKLRKRLTEMEKLLEKREAAKSDIVDLQLKMFINESEGMGFFGGMPGETVMDFTTRWSTSAPAPLMPGVPHPPETPVPTPGTR